MTTTVRYNAYVAMLAQPDRACLPKRGRRYLCAGDPDRDPDQIKRDLARAYIEHRKHDHVDESVIVSLRRTRLRLARTA